MVEKRMGSQCSRFVEESATGRRRCEVRLFRNEGLVDWAKTDANNGPVRRMRDWSVESIRSDVNKAECLIG